MTRDTFEFMDEATQTRGRFGESKRDNEASKSDLVDLDLLLCGQTPLAIGVRKPENAGGKWIWIPKSKCEYEIKNRGEVRVTLSQRYAEEKRLV